MCSTLARVGLVAGLLAGAACDELTRVWREPSEVERDASPEPGAEVLYVGGLDANISVFGVDMVSGALTARGTTPAGNTPTSLVSARRLGALTKLLGVLRAARHPQATRRPAWSARPIDARFMRSMKTPAARAK